MGRLVHCIAFVGILCAPALQSLTGIAPRRPLGGVERPVPPTPPVTLASWHDGTLQAAVLAGFDRGLGLRDWIVRTDDQLRYWLSGTTKGDVTCGRDGWLHHTSYLPACDQADAATQRLLLMNLANLRRLQEVLDRRGVLLMLLLSPNKSRLFPERLPALHRRIAAAPVPSHHEFVAEYLRESGLHCLDAHALFGRWKADGVDFPLFPRGGAHWSAFACAKVAALLLDELDRCGVDVRNLDVANGGASDGPQAGEDDLVAMANLLDERPWSESTPVPIVAVRAGDESGPIRLLVEGTSFVAQILDVLNAHRIASPMTFLSYLTTRHDYAHGVETGQGPTGWDRRDLQKLRDEVLANQVVLVEINEMMLPMLGHGMVEGLLLLFGEPVLQELTPDLEAYRARNAARR